MNEDALRFPLSEHEGSRVLSPDELLGLHLKELLDLLVPVQENRELRVDGYKLLSDRQTVHPLNTDLPQDCERHTPLDLYEPRVSYIRRLLESLLSLIELESAGRPVRVDAFRLKRLDHWLTSGGGAADILAHAATRCNLSCRFCYNSGAPPALKQPVRSPRDEYEEILTRIEYYVPSGKLNIFPNMGSPAETLAQPYILDILRRLRQKTGEVFRISTNGGTLTPDMIRALSELGPIYLDVSLNSSSPERRSWLMNDPSPATAIDSLALLRENRIPFTIVIVPWPFPSHEEMRRDLEDTAIFAATFEPVVIQISLPGYTRALPPDECFSVEEVWNGLKAACQRLRNRLDCPLVLRPGLFEEYTDADACNDALVVGMVKNSPAAKAGLRAGDRIKKVNGLPVRSRPQARALLNTLHQSDLPKASLSIEREESLIEFELDLLNFGYPYTPETATHLGVVFSSAGIPREWVERVSKVVASRRAKEVLLLTSRLVRPTLEKLMSQNGLASEANIYFHVPENDFFGGDIFMGDLMVVEDFIKATRQFMGQRKIRPDLILVPSSPFHLSCWGRDLTGRVYLDIERALGIPVALVECNPIFD